MHSANLSSNKDPYDSQSTQQGALQSDQLEHRTDDLSDDDHPVYNPLIRGRYKQPITYCHM